MCVCLTVTWLMSQGRMKFTRPLYREMMKSPAAGASIAARKTFKSMAKAYHPICRKMVTQDFKAHDKSSVYSPSFPPSLPLPLSLLPPPLSPPSLPFFLSLSLSLSPPPPPFISPSFLSRSLSLSLSHTHTHTHTQSQLEVAILFSTSNPIETQ